MEKRRGLVLGIVGCLIFINIGLSFSQGPQEEPQTQWLWGEAVSVDTTNKMLSVKYFDYETDQEKDIAITTDDQTSYENVSSLSEIKIKDALSIDYIIGADGKNIAKLISVEKPESPMPETQNVETLQDTETLPQDINKEPSETQQ
jgi:hypothetical protein